MSPAIHPNPMKGQPLHASETADPAPASPETRLRHNLTQPGATLGTLLTLVLAPASLADVFSVQNDATIRSQLLTAQAAQRRDAAAWTTFHDFQFSDRLPESGIQFVHHMTDDSGRAEKAVHYDHGSGVAAADVEGDGLPDLFFANQLGGNQLWLNQGGNRFRNISDIATIALPGRVSVAACFADLDNDGDPDLVVSTVREGNAVFENLGKGRFRDRSETAGFTSRHHSSGIVPIDVDHDGLLDLVITSVGRYTTDTRRPSGDSIGLPDAFSGHLYPDRSEPALLYRNRGGFVFQEIAGQSGLTAAGWAGDAVSGDFNSDGYPDLYVINMQGDDHLYLNLPDGRFQDQTARYFPRTPWGAMGVGILDWNRDGILDVFVTDMHSDMTGGQAQLRRGFNSTIDRSKSDAWCSVQWTEAFLQDSSNNLFGNAFFQRKPDGTSDEISDRIGVETYCPWGVSVGDLNADGFEDVFITAGMGYPFPYAINTLLLNDSGKRFRAAEFVTGIEPRRSNAVSHLSFRLDCLGADKSHRLCEGVARERVVEASLSSRSSVLLDLDNDGDLDLVTNEFDGPPQILINNLQERRQPRFLKLQLTGTRSNRDALGATVNVRSGKIRHVHFISGKSGYLGSSSLPLYLGLGDTSRIDEIEILWPSGRRQSIHEGIPETGLFAVREPSEP